MDGWGYVVITVGVEVVRWERNMMGEAERGRGVAERDSPGGRVLVDMRNDAGSVAVLCKQD